MLKKFLIGSFVALALMVATSASAAWDFGPTTLKVGSKGEYVKTLQTLVGASPVDGIFGNGTKAKVMAWQANNGLTADGLFGAMSKAKANAGGSMTYPAGCTSSTGYSSTTGMPCNSTTTYPAGCTSAMGYSTTTGQACSGGTVSTGPLAGTVGSLDYTLTSGYENEEVGENQNDVKVAGLEVDADDSDSDVSITAVKLNFNRGTAAAATDLDDVAEEVTVWLGTTKVATVPASDFNDDNNEEKTVSLSNAIVRMDTQADLFVALSGVNNLDSGDIGDTWTVDFTQVRFVDAQGATTSEDPTTAVRTFTFESFATANNVELEVKLNTSEDAVNEAHVINVDATDDTDDVPLLAFTLKADGDSDVNLQELPVLITVTGAGNVDDVVTSVDLYHGTTKVDSQNIPATAGATETVTFDDLDLDINSGSTEKFWVKGNFISLADALDAGDTIKIEMTATEVDAIDAEDESGENLVAADLTGTALGEASEARDIGIMVALVGTPTAVVSTTGEPTVQADAGTFTITFDATAFDGDAYIDYSAPLVTGTGSESDLTMTGSGTATATLTSPSGATLAANSTFKIDEGETERFTITVNVTDGGTDLVDGFFDIALADLRYALTAIDANVSYTFNLSDFKTPQIYLDDRGF